MKDNIFEIAKVIVESDPEKSKRLWTTILDAGYEGVPHQLMREISATLLAVWDGKASTLDQAAAWRTGSARFVPCMDDPGRAHP